MDRVGWALILLSVAGGSNINGYETMTVLGLGGLAYTITGVLAWAGSTGAARRRQHTEQQQMAEDRSRLTDQLDRIEALLGRPRVTPHSLKPRRHRRMKVRSGRADKVIKAVNQSELN